MPLPRLTLEINKITTSLGAMSLDVEAVPPPEKPPSVYPGHDPVHCEKLAMHELLCHTQLRTLRHSLCFNDCSGSLGLWQCCWHGEHHLSSAEVVLH